MVTNGKYTGGGMVINPFANMNDGLCCATWISDPALNNLFGVAGMLGDAKKHGGTQAYKGQNTYMRGKQIRIVFRGRRGATEEFNARPQIFGIDGEDLRYQTTVTWECMHNNIETLFDTQTYFKEHHSFYSNEELQVKQVVNQVFTDFDADRNDELNENELSNMMQQKLGDEWRPNEFRATSQSLSKNGPVRPEDLANFLLKQD